MIVASWGAVAATAPLAFTLGALVGFWLANRYRISRRTDDVDDEDTG